MIVIGVDSAVEFSVGPGSIDLSAAAFWLLTTALYVFVAYLVVKYGVLHALRRHAYEQRQAELVEMRRAAMSEPPATTSIPADQLTQAPESTLPPLPKGVKRPPGYAGAQSLNYPS